MTRAEEAANKAYPSKITILGFYSTGELMTKNFNVEKRHCFIEGYEQAEKDLALTWEDMRAVNQCITAAIKRILPGDESAYPEPEYNEADAKQFYEEVLKRFNETRKRG